MFSQAVAAALSRGTTGAICSLRGAMFLKALAAAIFRGTTGAICS